MQPSNSPSGRDGVIGHGHAPDSAPTPSVCRPFSSSWRVVAIRAHCRAVRDPGRILASRIATRDARRDGGSGAGLRRILVPVPLEKVASDPAFVAAGEVLFEPIGGRGFRRDRHGLPGRQSGRTHHLRTAGLLRDGQRWPAMASF